jgi:hypothetical protein
MGHTMENRKLARTSFDGGASIRVNDAVVRFENGPVEPIQGNSSEINMIGGGVRFSPSFEFEQRLAERSANALPEYPKRC